MWLIPSPCSRVPSRQQRNASGLEQNSQLTFLCASADSQFSALSYEEDGVESPQNRGYDPDACEPEREKDEGWLRRRKEQAHHEKQITPPDQLHLCLNTRLSHCNNFEVVNTRDSK